MNLIRAGYVKGGGKVHDDNGQGMPVCQQYGRSNSGRNVSSRNFRQTDADVTCGRCRMLRESRCWIETSDVHLTLIRLKDGTTSDTTGMCNRYAHKRTRLYSRVTCHDCLRVELERHPDSAGAKARLRVLNQGVAA